MMMVAATPIVRTIAEAEIESVQQLIYRTIEFSYGPVYPRQALDYFRSFHSLDRIRERYEKGIVLAGEVAGSLAATGAFLDGEILGVFVGPDFQRSGLGRSIMQELERIAVSKGYSQVRLSVSLPSRQFYESLGYRIVETCSQPVGDGAYLDHWKARKVLKT